MIFIMSGMSLRVFDLGLITIEDLIRVKGICITFHEKNITWSLNIPN